MSGSRWVEPGVLYVVATPIGNLSDITSRAIAVLEQSDVVFCEDTRHSARLLHSIGLKRNLLSLHEHNERVRVEQVMSCLENNQSVALISDAGTPLISDPGYVVVSQAAQRGLTVRPIPGVSAVTCALSASGLPTDRWRFEGFLPNKLRARQAVLESLKQESITLVFFESSHRIVDTLQDILLCFGADRPVVLARELTKTYETYLRGSAIEVLTRVQQDPSSRKGEFVLMVQGAQPSNEVSSEHQHYLDALLSHLMPWVPPKKLAAILADVYGGNKKDYYQTLVASKQDER